MRSCFLEISALNGFPMLKWLLEVAQGHRHYHIWFMIYDLRGTASYSSKTAHSSYATYIWRTCFPHRNFAKIFCTTNQNNRLQSNEKVWQYVELFDPADKRDSGTNKLRQHSLYCATVSAGKSGPMYGQVGAQVNTPSKLCNCVKRADIRVAHVGPYSRLGVTGSMRFYGLVYPRSRRKLPHGSGKMSRRTSCRQARRRLVTPYKINQKQRKLLFVSTVCNT